MINLKIEESKAIDMLVDRLIEYWNPDKETIKLFTKMYENYVYS